MTRGEQAACCPVCRGPMPAPRRTGRPPKFCGDRCRKAAERERRAGERREAERQAHRAYLAQLAAERQRAAVELVTLMAEDPQATVSAIEHGVRSFTTYDLTRLCQEIAASRRKGEQGA